MKRLSALAIFLFLALPSIAMAAGDEEFNPEHDFDPGEWIPIHLGPIDLSINKTVAYLILGTILTIALGLFLMRARIGSKNEVGRRQAVGELDLRRRADPGRRAGPAAQGDESCGSRTSRR